RSHSGSTEPEGGRGRKANSFTEHTRGESLQPIDNLGNTRAPGRSTHAFGHPTRWYFRLKAAPAPLAYRSTATSISWHTSITRRGESLKCRKPFRDHARTTGSVSRQLL